MHTSTLTAPAPSNRPRRDRLASCVAALGAYLNMRRDLIRLSQMSDHMLSDIGLTRDQARSARPARFPHFVS